MGERAAAAAGRLRLGRQRHRRSAGAVAAVSGRGAAHQAARHPLSLSAAMAVALMPLLAGQSPVDLLNSDWARRSPDRRSQAQPRPLYSRPGVASGLGSPPQRPVLCYPPPPPRARIPGPASFGSVAKCWHSELPAQWRSHRRTAVQWVALS